MPDKTEVICFRVLNIKDPANPHTPQPGWLAIPLTSSDDLPRGYGVFRASGNSSVSQTGLVNCTTTVTDSKFFAAERSMDGPPMSMFSITSSLVTSG